MSISRKDQNLVWVRMYVYIYINFSFSFSETDQTVMTDDESSMVDIATSNTLYTHAIDLKSTNHVLGSCFGLPYQV